MKKNKRELEGFAACYTYKSCGVVRYVYIYFDDDAKAIDLLLQHNLERQAIHMTRQGNNRIFRQIN